MKFSVLLIFITLLIFSTAHAQQIKNVSYSQEGKTVKLEFDLIGKASDRYYVALFSSVDNYTEPLLYVTGDVGKDISPGKNEIIWDAKKELGNFKGQIRFKLKARYIPLLEFTNLNNKTKFKKGKSHTITWEGGPDSGDVQLDLLKGSQTVASLASVGNTGTWTWDIPKDFDKGSYRIRASANGRAETTENFKIVPKVPMAAIIIPGALAVGGVVFLIVSQSGGSESNDIPDPLKPN